MTSFHRIIRVRTITPYTIGLTTFVLTYVFEFARVHSCALHVLVFWIEFCGGGSDIDDVVFYTKSDSLGAVLTVQVIR